jgi:hypothetical protein
LFTQSDTNQLNLTSRFALKANLASPTFTGTVSGITKSMVGLGNVDNTSDANKPISTATQTALNLKFNTADTVSLSNRINLKFNTADTSQLNLTSRFAAKLNYTDTSFLFTQSDTSQLNLTSRFNTKQNTLSGTGFVKASGTSITYDNSSYLTTGTAASTYLPLTGGTLTGSLNGTTGIFTTRLGVGGIEASTVPTLFTSGSGDQEVHFTHSDNVEGRKVSLRLTNNNSGFYTYGGLIYAIQGEGLNQYNRMSFGVNTSEIMHLTRFSRVGILNNSPSYTLDVNGTFNASGNTLIGGTLGVTGAATLSSTLAVTGDITENGNNVLTNLDTVSLSTRIDARLNKSDTATMLNPYWRADKFSGTLPITNGGTGAESASVARTTLGVGYTFYSTTTGATVLFSSNRVSLVITGTGSTTTIDLTTATNGRQYMIKNLSNATVISSSSNVIPLAGGSAGTAILSAGNVTPQWVTLVADGTNWHVMQSN